MSVGEFEDVLRQPGPFLAGVVLAVVILVAAIARWHWRSEERSDDIVLFMALPCTVSLLAVIATPSLSFGVVFALFICSSMTFLALIWIDMLFLSGHKAFPQSAPVALLIALLLVFCVVLLVGHLMPLKTTNTLVIPLITLVYLIYLPFHFERAVSENADGWTEQTWVSVVEGAQSTAPKHEDTRQLTYDEIRLRACKQMAEDFSLSAKESEVLPLLVTGISAAAIGRQLFISHETVKTHKYHIYQKLGVHNYEEALGIFEEYANRVVATD